MKSIFSSWTIWFGVAQLALAVTGYFSGSMEQDQAFTLLVTGLGTLGFRFKTTQPII